MAVLHQRIIPFTVRCMFRSQINLLVIIIYVCSVTALNLPAISSRKLHQLPDDGVSWRILLEDLELLLNSINNNDEKIDLGAKHTSYREWYNALVKYGHSKRLLSQREYWEKVTKSFYPLLVE